MQPERPILIYIYSLRAPFVQKDIDFLSKTYTVIHPPDCNWSEKNKTPLYLIRQLGWLLRWQRKAKVTLVMFGGYWGLFPALLGRILGRPVMVILGGTDCVSFPPLQYGSLRKPLRRRIIGWVYRLATRLLPVDASLVGYDYTYDPASPFPRQGYTYFFPRLKTPHTVIHNGFRPEVFDFSPDQKISNTFITVAYIGDTTTLWLKGIDRLVLLAHAFPACSFTVVGIPPARRAELGALPANLTLISKVPLEEFMPLMQQHEFYLQLSISEGFPNALCEGMLCGCIPIGSNVAAIPMIIGDTGFVMAHSEPAYLQSQIADILATPPEVRQALAQAARKRVMTHYTLAQREKAFLDVLAAYS
jgi:glycosyltransferase involved in cell wall biosynthesis